MPVAGWPIFRVPRLSRKACSLAVAAFAAIVSPMVALADESALTLDGGISATLNMPSHSGPVPAVLMLHGFGSSKDEVGGMYARAARALADKGIASIRIDFPGFGKSGGDAGDTTVDQQLDAAKVAFAALRKTEGVDPTRVGVLGFSLGGGIATLLASGSQGDVKSLVTWSSVGDFQTDFVSSLGQKAFDRAKDDGVVGLDLGWRTIALKQAFFESLGKYKLDDAIASYSGAYLAIAGAKDFSAAYPDRFEGLAKGQNKEVMIVPEGDHIYGVLGSDQRMADGVIAKTAEWFASTL
ncbi:alpha/beta fold hydrolase [Rhizobium sp. KVB221]|uniref:Alpha/beta fold hydrolase n=2 Tax=Rhizobium setariae TaxID=2801340 RepID=A0A937CKD9_9HYPH|nr:alpha/beta fold hydrolase [Rhizobium setariae]